MATYSGGVGIAPPLIGSSVTVGAPATGSKAVTVKGPGITKGTGKPLATSMNIAKSRPARPPNPAIGGHYMWAGNHWQLIHAVGPGKWAKGPVPTVAPGVRADNPLFNVNAPPTPQNIYDAAKAAASLQVDPGIAELTKQIAANDQHTRGVLGIAGGYFNQLAGSAQQGVTDQQGFGAALQNQLAGIASGTKTALEGIGTDATAALNKYAPQGEGNLSSAALSSLTAEMARQQGYSAQQSGNAAASGAMQSANYGGLASSALGSNALAGTEALRGIAQSGTVANQPLTNQIAGLQAKRGSLLTTTAEQLKQQAINNILTKAGITGRTDVAKAVQAGETARTKIVQAGATTRTKITTTAANTRAANTITATDRRATLDRNSREAIATANRNARQAARGQGGGNTKPLTPFQNNSWLGKIDTVRSVIQNWQRNGYPATADGQVIDGKTYKKGDRVLKPSNSLMRNTLARGGYSHWQIEAAFDLLGWGFITPATAKGMHASGVRGGGFRIALPPGSGGAAGSAAGAAAGR